MEKLISILSGIQDNSQIAIIGHKNPDADSIASARVLKNLIEQIHQDKKLVINLFFDGEINAKMKVLLDTQSINTKRKYKYEMAISVDCANPELMGRFKEIFDNTEETVNLDHHLTNTNFGKYPIVKDKCCTACIIYAIMKAEKFDISKDVAKLVYSAMITDTNCFTTNVNPITYKYAEELSKKKIDSDEILKFFFKTDELSRLKLLSKALNTLKLYANDTFALMYLRYVQFTRTKADFGDTLGIIDNAINSSQVQMAAIIIEVEPKKYYVSLRSKGTLDVSEVATKFNGGGHRTMAAFTYEGDFKVLKRSLVRACNLFVKKNYIQEGVEKLRFRLPKYRKDK